VQSVAFNPRNSLLLLPNPVGMRPNPGHFASDWFKATSEEYARVASTYFAYAGPFEVDEESRTVTHFVLVSLFLISQTPILCDESKDDSIFWGW
jgi:hypothetical protein